LKMDKEETEYMLRWSEHNPQVMAIFHQMWEAGQLTDVTLATEEGSFQAHKMLLSACSPYFRQLFLNNPCKRPTVFLKDVPASHMRLLLQYMYQGGIAVKHSELAEILKTASSLKIRGLTTAEEAGDNNNVTNNSNSSSVPPLVLEEDKFHQLETASNTSAASGVSGTSRRTHETQGTGGRKSSKPKKLRLSGDTDSSEVTSPRFPAMAKITEDQDITDHEIEEEKELVIDQPVDFSNTKPEKTNKTSLESKYSILGSYLKAGKAGEKLASKSATDLSETMRLAGLNSGWMNSLSSLSAPRPASRDSRGYSKEDEEDLEAGDRANHAEEYPQLSLSETMGLGDIAERLRANFLSNLPTLTPGARSYNWLGQNSLLEKVKREKHNSGPGGIRTDIVSASGKAAVKCEECGKVLADPSSLYRHRKIHTGEKPHKCPYCDRRFIQRFNMKQHIKTHRIELMAEQNAAAALSGFAQ